ncbi:MAG: aspartate carbamoyltransferase catalytic subunit [Phycisphaerales bacterium]
MPATTTPAAPAHLLGLQGMPAPDLRMLLADAHQVAVSRGSVGTPLAGKVVANLFFEDSTRTRLSFSVAAKRLGADVIDLLGGNSSVSKGETLIDTARNIEAMGVAAFVVRARQSGSAALIARHVGVPVLNAGDGRHEHPTQGLLDIYTLCEHFQRTKDFSLAGLRIAIVGDVNASRVARSNIAGMATLGAEVTCVGSPGLAPRSLESLGCRVTEDFASVLPSMDAVMMLRIQFERYDAGKDVGADRKPNVIASVREYRARYALTAERETLMKQGAVVMHPGPINRGIELDAEVADGPRSLILRQVTNGVYVRMAALRGLVGPGEVAPPHGAPRAPASPPVAPRVPA